MGLDISAYRGLKAAPDAALGGDGNPQDWDSHVVFRQTALDYTEKEWPGRTEGLRAGVYAPTEAFSFRAGSYSGYNYWRNQLAVLAFGKPAEKVWADASIKAGPFYELIHFSDCEGVIGPVVSKKLAADFVENQQKAEMSAAAMGLGEGDFFLRSYANWRRAFEMASDGGAVDFH